MPIGTSRRVGRLLVRYAMHGNHRRSVCADERFWPDIRPTSIDGERPVTLPLLSFGAVGRRAAKGRSLPEVIALRTHEFRHKRALHIAPKSGH